MKMIRGWLMVLRDPNGEVSANVYARQHGMINELIRLRDGHRFTVLWTAGRSNAYPTDKPTFVIDGRLIIANIDYGRSGER